MAINLVLRLDFDRCLALDTKKMYELIARTPRASHDTEAYKIRYISSHVAQFPLLLSIVELIKTKRPQVVFLLSFSNRQDFNIETLNQRTYFSSEQYPYLNQKMSKDNCCDNHNLFELALFSSVMAITLVQKILRYIFPRITIEIMPFLLADLDGYETNNRVSDDSFGESFFAIQNYYQERPVYRQESKAERAETLARQPALAKKSQIYNDEDKLALALLQNFYISHYLQNTGSPPYLPTLVVSFDDLYDVLNSVKTAHQLFPAVASKALMFDFRHVVLDRKNDFSGYRVGPASKEYVYTAGVQEGSLNLLQRFYQMLCRDFCQKTMFDFERRQRVANREIKDIICQVVGCSSSSLNL